MDCKGGTHSSFVLMIFSAPAVIISINSSLFAANIGQNRKQMSNVPTGTKDHPHLSTAVAGPAE
jgi:hypothetical protein